MIHTIRLDKMGLIGSWGNQKLGIPHLTDIITNEARRLLTNPRKRTIWREIITGAVCLHCLNIETVRLLKENGVPDSKIWYQPNAVDIQQFAPLSGKPSASQVTALCCGRIEKQKGSDILLAAWKLLPEEVSQKCRLLFLGNGKWEAVIRDEAKSVVGVFFENTVQHRLMPDYYRNAAVYVQPSRFEGMSNSVLEAMASGLPIVATDIAGNQDLVRHGDNGYLVPVEDPRRLAEALQELLLNPGLRKEMGLKSRNIAESSFAFEKLFESYAGKYEEIYKPPGG